ncbi:MAG: hypothetical protein L6V93_10975 [Clostridiales bacterium]|nr:MAG: hypothetical protein L6V93_10975 [Clostridiales bacterium]
MKKRKKSCKKTTVRLSKCLNIKESTEEDGTIIEQSPKADMTVATLEKNQRCYKRKKSRRK